MYKHVRLSMDEGQVALCSHIHHSCMPRAQQPLGEGELTTSTPWKPQRPSTPTHGSHHFPSCSSHFISICSRLCIIRCLQELFTSIDITISTIIIFLMRCHWPPSVGLAEVTLLLPPSPTFSKESVKPAAIYIFRTFFIVFVLGFPLPTSVWATSQNS